MGGATRGSISDGSIGITLADCQPAASNPGRSHPLGSCRASMNDPSYRSAARMTPVDATQVASLAITIGGPSANAISNCAIRPSSRPYRPRESSPHPSRPRYHPSPSTPPITFGPSTRRPVTSYVSARSRRPYGVQPGARRSSETGRPLIVTALQPNDVTWSRPARGRAGSSNARRSSGDGDCRSAPGSPGRVIDFATQSPGVSRPASTCRESLHAVQTPATDTRARNQRSSRLCSAGPGAGTASWSDAATTPVEPMIVSNPASADAWISYASCVASRRVVRILQVSRNGSRPAASTPAGSWDLRLSMRVSEVIGRPALSP